MLLAELVNVIKPGLIDTRALKPIDFGRYEEGMKRMASAAQVSTVDTDLSKTMFEVTNNLNQAINAAKKVGIVVVNIGANDFLERKQDLILGIVWQLIRYHLLSAVNLNSHPELVRLLQPNETMSTLLGLPAEATLLRWFNYHLQRAGVQRTIKNFSKDVQDCELYIKLLSQIAPPKHKEEIDILLARATSFSGETEPGRLGRAQLVLEAAALLGARKFATAKDIVQGNAKLNLGFTATLFNREIGINLPSEDEMRQQKTLIQRQADSIDELQKVVEQKDNTITQLGLMIRGKDERILELNEKVRETTLARLEEKDDLEKKSLDAKAELAAYKKKVAVGIRRGKGGVEERNPNVLFAVRVYRAPRSAQGAGPRCSHGSSRFDGQNSGSDWIHAPRTEGPTRLDRETSD